MIEAQFGIIDDIEQEDCFLEIEKYHCIYINDDYMDDWWQKLLLMKTYFHSLSRPEHGLARWGITIIPPESLGIFQDIVLSDKRIYKDEQLALLSQMIQQAIEEQKYMIHFGV